MMKMIKRLLTALTAVSMCISATCSFVTVNAAVIDNGDVVAPANIAITKGDYDFYETSGGALSCYGKTSVQAGYKSGVVVELQRYNGGWTTVKTWSSRGNTISVVDETYKPLSGYNYRLKISYKAYDSSWNLIETITKYSGELYY